GCILRGSPVVKFDVPQPGTCYGRGPPDAHAQAAMTAPDGGRVQREMAPAKSRVTMSPPSRCTPITADLCTGKVQSLAPLAASQNRSEPSASPTLPKPASAV